MPNNHTELQSCQCAVTCPPCSFCTDTTTCEKCGDRVYSEHVNEELICYSCQLTFPMYTRSIRRSARKDYFAIDLINSEGLIESTPIYLKPGERAQMQIYANRRGDVGWQDCELEYSDGQLQVLAEGDDAWMPTNAQLQDEEKFRFPIQTQVQAVTVHPDGSHWTSDEYVSSIPADDRSAIEAEVVSRIKTDERMDIVIFAEATAQNGGEKKIYFIPKPQ